MNPDTQQPHTLSPQAVKLIAILTAVVTEGDRTGTELVTAMDSMYSPLDATTRNNLLVRCHREALRACLKGLLK